MDEKIASVISFPKTIRKTIRKTYINNIRYYDCHFFETFLNLPQSHPERRCEEADFFVRFDFPFIKNRRKVLMNWFEQNIFLHQNNKTFSSICTSKTLYLNGCFKVKL